jgi:glycosyltransferase involved in cell wall biosynthesis
MVGVVNFQASVHYKIEFFRMRAKVWHLIGDKRAGGSNHLVRHLIASLGKSFDFSMLRLEEAKQKLPRHKPDLIIFHYPCAWKYLPDLRLLKKYSPVYICDHHYCQGFEQHQVSSRFRFRLMLRLAYSLADGVVGVSQAQRQWLISANLVTPKKITVITPALPLEDLLHVPAKKPGNLLVLGAYGRFARQKGFDLLLETFAQKTTELPPEHFQLYLGGYGPDEAMIQQLAEGLPQVQLLGTINDVPGFLAACDVVVIPSRWEPWGLVALEAKAAGKPILAFAIDGLSEQGQGCGLLIPPDNVSELAKGISSLPKSPLVDWGKAGRVSVIHAWEEFLQNWESFLEKACKS